MAKKVTTAGAAVARRPAAAAAKPAALTPQQKANAAAVAALAKSLGVKAEIEGAEEPTAEVVETVLVNGAGSLFTDGALAEGSAVFNDQELSVITADGVYESEDGQDITVAGGVVDTIETAAEAAAEEEEAETPTVAALRKQVETLTAAVEKFSRAVPPTPKAKGSSQVPDPKAPVPKAKGVLKGASAPAGK